MLQFFSMLPSLPRRLFAFMSIKIKKFHEINSYLAILYIYVVFDMIVVHCEMKRVNVMLLI